MPISFDLPVSEGLNPGGHFEQSHQDLIAAQEAAQDAASDVGSGPATSSFFVDESPEVTELIAAHGYDAFPSFCSDPLGFKDFSCVSLRRAIPRLLVTFTIFLTGVYGNNVSQAWLQKYMANYYQSNWQAVPPHKGTVILWDFGYYNFPGVLSTYWADFFATWIPTSVFIRYMVVPGPMSMRWTILCRMFLIWGLLWGLRGFTIIATVLPNPDPLCKPEITFPDNIYLEALANMPIGFWGPQMTCQDVLFSGHTVAITLATCSGLRYVYWAPWTRCSTSSSVFSGIFAYKLAFGLLMFVGYYVIIASRFHYTIDVMVGSAFTILIWQGYHSQIRIAFLSQKQKEGLNVTHGINAFIRWFEAYAIDVKVLKTAMRNYKPTQSWLTS